MSDKHSTKFDQKLNKLGIRTRDFRMPGAHKSTELWRPPNELFYSFFADPSGWWNGKNGRGHEGLFPGSYVEKLN